MLEEGESAEDIAQRTPLDMRTTEDKCEEAVDGVDVLTHHVFPAQQKKIITSNSAVRFNAERTHGW